MAPVLVGLYSPASQSGKSTAAGVLTRLHGFEAVKFAGPLKEMTRAFFRSMGLGPHAIEQMVEGGAKEQLIPELGVSSRRIMETLGTDWGREIIHPEVWIKLVERDIATRMLCGNSVVVDDMRFPNELDMIRRMGGVAVRIDRACAVPSEKEGRLNGQPFDHYLSNDAGQAEFRAQVDLLATRLSGNR